jgi:hypothetical protein
MKILVPVEFKIFDGGCYRAKDYAKTKADALYHVTRLARPRS